MEQVNMPLIDLKAQHHKLASEIEGAISRLIIHANFILGEEVDEFEKAMCAYLGVKHCITVANGTDALVLSLKALGIGKGDEVITTPFTFFATAESIASVGAIPVFIDIEPKTYNLDVNKIEQRITEKTKAIMPVHIFGTPVAMKQLKALAQKYGLKIIEDACQAIGATYHGQKVGTLGDTGCFSFFPTKNLGCVGDGGMVATNNSEVATLIRALRSHGGGQEGKEAYKILNRDKESLESLEAKTTSEKLQLSTSKYHNYLIGVNSRLDALQAAILKIKLSYLDKWNEQRRVHGAYYNEQLKSTTFTLPIIEGEEDEKVVHLYILQSDHRDALTKYLNHQGISTGIYYPIPLHLQKAFNYLGYKKGDLPICERIAQRTFAIPVYPELSETQREYIVKKLQAWEESHVR